MADPLRWRKKPVVIEAFRMTQNRRWDNSEWPDWLNRAWNEPLGNVGALWIDPTDKIGTRLFIGTLEGDLLVSFGDWIVRGIRGELYPVRADIFEATYEQADAPAPAPQGD